MGRGHVAHAVRRSIGAVTTVLFAAGAFGQQRPTIPAVRAPGPVPMSAGVSEACWDSAPKISGLVDLYHDNLVAD